MLHLKNLLDNIGNHTFMCFQSTILNCLFEMLISLGLYCTERSGNGVMTNSIKQSIYYVMSLPVC